MDVFGIGQMIGATLGAGASIYGAWKNNKTQKSTNDQNINLQREFAQNSIQWRVNDAKKAGIHPLYAIGANGVSFTPSSVNSSFGDGIAQAGSQLGQGIANAMQFEQQKNARLQNELLQSQIESQKLQNSAFARNMGQQSNQQNKVNEALVLNAVSPKVNTKTLKDPTNIYLGKDKSQLIDDLTSDNTILGTLSQARQIEKQAPWIFNGSKLDFIDSLLNLSPQYVDKKDATLLDRFLYNINPIHHYLNWRDKYREKYKRETGILKRFKK